jgi:hypothetical protein
MEEFLWELIHIWYRDILCFYNYLFKNKPTGKDKQ